MANRDWKTGVIVLVAVMAGALMGQSGLLSRAHGISEGQTSGVMALIGDVFSNTAPIVVVDVPDQTIVVYEYSYSSDRIELTSARSFRYDKLLTDYNTRGASVNEVRDFVQSRR